MAASEHEHEVSGTSGVAGASLQPTPPTPEQQTHPRRGHLSTWLMVAAAVVVVAALAAVLLGRAGLSAGSGGTSGSWQTYHDPFGLFTLRLPPGWAAQVEPTTGGFGDRYGRVTERMDNVSFDDPAQGTGSAYVSVFAIPLQTALAHQTFCRGNAIPQLQRFSPTTLRALEPSGYQLFTTENASFQVDVSIPGIVTPVRFGPPPPPATPIPAAWAATDTSEVNALLVSFQPTDPKPLTC